MSEYKVVDEGYQELRFSAVTEKDAILHAEEWCRDGAWGEDGEVQLRLSRVDKPDDELVWKCEVKANC